MPEDVSPDSRSEAELDQLADSTEQARNSERPMKEGEAPAGKEGAAPAPWKEDEFEHSGKKVKGTREQILKWAQMGYDRPQWAQKFNQDKAKWEKERGDWDKQKQEWESKWGIYREIDQFATQNKDWWNHVTQSWQTRGQAQAAAGQGQQVTQQGTGSQDPMVRQLAERLSQFEQNFIPKFEKLNQELEQKEIAQVQKREDDELAGEIQSIRAQHKDLDWESLDENGKSLEVRVLEHAQEIGTKSFRAAMRDLLHDTLVTRAESQGKIAVAKGIQAKSKLGVLGESPTPQKWNPKSNRDIRKTSYEELENDIREELRSGRVGA